MSASASREDLVKALYMLDDETSDKRNWISTKDLAELLAVKPPSVTSMLHVLVELGWVEHRPYRGARLTLTGHNLALSLVRKHRLWETFLVHHLGFPWEEVHDIAEQLEHIDSLELVNRLDAYLGNPVYDPHGDPIPNAQGAFSDDRKLVPLYSYDSELPCRVGGVRNGSNDILAALSARGIELGTVLQKEDAHQLPLSLAEEILVHAMIEETPKDHE